MAFADDLKAYLSDISVRVEVGQTLSVTLSPAWVRGVVVQCFERLDAIAPASASLGSLPARRTLPALLNDWQSNDRSVRFAQALASLLQSSFLAGASGQEIEHGVRTGIARRLHLEGSLGSAIRDAELDRLTQLAWSSVHQSSRDERNAPSTYAQEIGATRRKDRGIEVTAIGRIILELTGRDVIQWLLSVELASSTGAYDHWRLSRSAGEFILRTPRRVEYDHVWEEESLGFSWQTMRRLGELGVVDYIETHDEKFGHSGTSGYELTSFGEPLLRSLVSPTETPFSVLAQTLTQDLAVSTLNRTAWDVAGYTAALASIQATALQARFFAHEIRNALPPAQIALESMLDELRGSEAATTIGRYAPRISAGINRVFNVVKGMQRLTELATQPPDRFDLLSAVRDGVSEIAGSNGTTITMQEPPAPLPAIMGYRARFVLTVMNLLRNAQQVHATKVLISTSVSDDGARVFLDVDDDGPGVPVEQRRAIFEPGISLREGGSGQGLALVREVIEREMHGWVECVTSPLGGARFHIELPVGSRSER
jgi:signal transduction histidine kinase